MLLPCRTAQVPLLYYHHRCGVSGLGALTENAILRLEMEAQDALYAALENFPGPLGPVASAAMKVRCFPLGGASRPYSEPSNNTLTKEVSHLLTMPSAICDMIKEGIYLVT
ncbi:hypothetical protein ACHAWF_004155 [Thalassiosira exigua]